MYKTGTCRHTNETQTIYVEEITRSYNEGEKTEYGRIKCDIAKECKCNGNCSILQEKK